MLALAARHGDSAAAAAFVRETQPSVWRMCVHLGSRQAADDLTQETYARAFASLHRFAGRSSARTWLLSIARHVCADAVRLAVRSRALTAPDSEAETHYRSAIEILTSAGIEIEAARAYLLYGEWLRRRKRRREAREHLRIAMKMFEQGGAGPFAHRARTELEATGEHVTSEPERGFDLTPQEATVARLAAQGRTNAEIGASMFVSPNTVDYHLRKVLQKLGISSRRQLVDRLDASPQP